MDIEEERQRIDQINSDIIEDIGDRMEVVASIAEKKEEYDEEIEDTGREQEVIKQFRQGFSDIDLPEQKGEDMAEFLISLAKDYQSDRR